MIDLAYLLAHISPIMLAAVLANTAIGMAIETGRNILKVR